MRALLLVVALLGPAAAAAPPPPSQADAPAPVLSLETVLAAVDARVPELAAAEAKRAEAAGKRLGAAGAFDPTLRAKVDQELTGPYPRIYADSSLSYATPYGPRIEAGYRVGVGDYPDYYGAYETLPLGEARVQLAVPLLQDLGITAERAKWLVARQLETSASALADAKRQAIMGKAAASWLKWVASGEKLEVAREQERLAAQRAQGLREQVRLGAAPQLYALDNEQALLARKAAVVEAERELERAAIALSLYFRDASMQPIVPTPDQLPGRAVPRPPAEAVGALVDRALQARPDLAVMDALLAGAQVEADRSRSTLLPKLEAQVGVARDLAPADSPYADDKKGKTELDLGAKLEVPLALRKGRGERARALAAVSRLQAERRGLRDAVRAEVQQAHQAWRRAVSAWELQQSSAAMAAQVAELEREAFQLGSSDIFRVNKREETLAKARKAEIEARLAAHMWEVELRTAVGGWSRGGAVPGSSQ